MYPQPELDRLAAYKASLLNDISRRRARCAAAAAGALQPLAWCDRALALWRRVGPLTAVAAVPLGFLVQRTVFPRLRFLGTLLRVGPLVFGAVRGLGTILRRRAPSARQHNGQS